VLPSLLQVVAAVATLSKATQQLSSDAKSKMLSVVDTSITCAKVNKQQVTADEATRMWAVVGAGNGIKASSGNTATSAAGTGSSRHLLAAEPQPHKNTQLLQPKCHEPDHQGGNRTDPTRSSGDSNDSSYWDGSNGSSYQLYGPPPRSLLEGTSTYVEPAFIASAQTIASLLSGAASPGAAYLSGGDSGLYVSVANQLGRSYAAGTGVVVGPVLTGTGGVAAATSGSNAVVSFSKPLTGSCVAEDGSIQAGTSCRCVGIEGRLSVPSSYLCVGCA
jgi:hypothetical protein